MNPPINELRTGEDWVQIANGDWFKVTGLPDRYPTIDSPFGNSSIHVHWLRDFGLLTATHRGDAPPATDREMLDWLESSRHSLYCEWPYSDKNRVWQVGRFGKKNLRDAIRAAMKEGNDDE